MASLTDLDLETGANGRVGVQRRFYRGRVDLPKSNKARTVTLVPAARAALGSLLELSGYLPHGLVFRNKTDGRLTPADADGVLEGGSRQGADRLRLLHRDEASRRLVHKGEDGSP
jgi:hypothetical protein